MDDGDYEVDILDESGKYANKKLRKNIIKGQDIYHAVYCVLTTPNQEIILNLIANRSDMPNLHAGSYGASAATIKRVGETSEQAMQRALANELKIASSTPKLLWENMMAIDNTYRKVGLYHLTSALPQNYNKQDIEELVVVTKAELLGIQKQTPHKITPVLGIFIEKYLNI